MTNLTRRMSRQKKKARTSKYDNMTEDELEEVSMEEALQCLNAHYFDKGLAYADMTRGERWLLSKVIRVYNTGRAVDHFLAEFQYGGEQ